MTLSNFAMFRRGLVGSRKNLVEYAPTMEPMAQRVISVVLDGTPAAFLQEVNPQNIRYLRDNGVVYRDCYTIFPPITGPAHTAMNTGTYPGKSGVTLPWYFDAVSMESRAINCLQSPVEFLAENLGAIGNLSAGICGHMMRGLFYFVSDVYIGHHASTVTDEAIRVMREYDPEYLGIVYFTSDTANHMFGIGSEESVETVQWIDSELGRLLNELADLGRDHNTVVVVTADHGHSNIQYSITDEVLAAVDGIDAHIVPYGRFLLCYGRQHGKHVIVEELRKRLTSVEGVGAVWGQDELQRVGSAHPSFGDAIILLKDGYYASGNDAFKTKSSHGSYTQNEIVVPLIIYGNNIRRGISAEFCEITDIAPTISRILGTRPPRDSQGRVLYEALECPENDETSMAHAGERRKELGGLLLRD